MAAAVILGIELSQAQRAPEPLTISGKLADGTSYRVTKPENWNGTVVLDLDGGIPPTRGFTLWMLDHGYAQGGTTRGACGYNFPQCVDNLVEVRRLFGERFGVPKRTIITGGSRGGFVARLALERYPKLFDGAMTGAGGGAGSIATMNSKLDAVWALKTLVNPKAPLRLVNITNVQEENAALTALLNEAIATPQGRARFTLAAAYEQFPLWSNPRIAEPAAMDYEAQLDQIASSFVFANPPTVREGMEKVAGGNIAWNDGIDYRRLLELSGRKDMVAALYQKADLDLDSDLATLDRTERISADSAALKRAEPLMSYTGKISGPIIVVDNDDPVDPAPLKLAYVETLKKAGTLDLLRMCWVHGAGHGGQTDIERVAGFVSLIHRLDSGKWSDTSPAAMNTLAEKLAKETPLQLGAPRFFESKPAMPLRTWDQSNWGTYAQAGTGGGAYDGYIRTSQYVNSFDGTRLAVDIYRPSLKGKVAEEKLPVLFMQMRPRAPAAGAKRLGPDPDAMILPYITHGYIIVAQDRRGSGASFGVSKGFITRDDARDGAAVVDWAGEQPWSSGKVGAFGCSNQGAFQIPMAAEHPKHLVAIAPECASSFFFDTMISPNGVSAFAGGFTPPYNGACEGKSEIGQPVDADNVPGTPLARAAAEEHRCNAAFLGQYWANMHRDSKHPYLGYLPGIEDSVVHRSAAVKSSGVKIYHLGAWFEANPGGQLQAWQLFGSKVLIGPWAHCASRDPGGGFANADFDKVKEQLRWFDYTLKGIDDGIGSELPVRYYTMNAAPGREWQSSQSWPLADQQSTIFFLGDPGAGSIESFNDGKLVMDRKVQEGADHYKPDYSVDLFEGKFSELMRFWKGDMAPTDAKGLTYTLAALDKDMQVTGHPVMHLWVTSTAKDEDFFALLEDVGPDGHSTYITDGKIRASRRKLSTPPWGDLGTPWHAQMTADDQPLSATKPAELVFDFTPTSWVFRAGHRVRVTILNSGGKRFQVPADWDRKNPPQITVHRGGVHASSLVLPLIPENSKFFVGSTSQQPR